MERKYERVVRFVQETPWALKPDMLLTIRGIVAAHLEGVELEKVSAAKKPSLSNQGSVAVLPLWGVIVPHADMMTNMSGGVALDSWIEDFRALVADASVSTIVLDIDSPGGAVAMVPEVAAEIRAANKKVIAVANTEAASAAYWLASQADEVVVPISGMVGSVGVIAGHTDTSKMEEMAGIKTTYITAGDYKAEQLGPLTDEAKANIQKNVDNAYALFVADVAKGRGVSASAVTANYGQGRMLMAGDALGAGMVDTIGTLDQILAREMPGGKKRMRALAENTELESLADGMPDLQDTEVEDVAIAAEETVKFSLGYVNDITSTTTITAGSFSGVSATGAGTTSNTANIVFDVPKSDDVLQQGVPAERGATTNPSKEAIMDERMTLDQLAARKDEITARMSEIHAGAQGRRFEDTEDVEFNALDDERAEIEAAIKNIGEREARLAAALGNASREIPGDGHKPVRNRAGIYTNAGRNLPDNIFDLTAYRGYGSTVEDMMGLFGEAANRVIETLPFETDTPDKAREHCEKLLKKDSKDRAFATRLLTTGSHLYDRAFGKMVLGQPLSTQEDAAIKAAVSNTGLGSETPVPVTIDPTVILTSDGAINPLRQIARTETITGNKWQGISSDGVDVAYEAELTQVADSTPSFDAPQAEVAKAHAYIEFSIEVDQDWGSLRSNLGLMFQDAKDMKEANKFLFGSGTNEPEGLIYALSNSTSVVHTDTVNTFVVGDLYLVRDALPPRFRSSASWLAGDATYSIVRQFDEAGGSALWAQLGADRPAVLIGKSVYEASEMSTLTDTGGEDIMIYGDFGRGFIIVDRVGMNVELIPHVLGANRRPIGARALYAYFRNTSTLLTENAFRMLRVKAS